MIKFISKWITNPSTFILLIIQIYKVLIASFKTPKPIHKYIGNKISSCCAFDFCSYIMAYEEGLKVLDEITKLA